MVQGEGFGDGLLLEMDEGEAGVDGVASATVLHCYSSKKCNGKSQRLKLYLYILIYINIKVFLEQKIGKF